MKRTSSLSSILDYGSDHDRISHFCTDVSGQQKKWLRDDFNIEEIDCKDIVVFNRMDSSRLVGQPFGEATPVNDQSYKQYSIVVKERLFQMKEVRQSSDQLTDGEVLHYIISSVNQEIHSISRDQEELLHTLSSREVEVLTLLAKGQSMTSIAKKLFLSPHTIDSHRIKLCKKLKVKRTTELAVWASKFGLLLNQNQTAT